MEKQQTTHMSAQEFVRIRKQAGLGLYELADILRIRGDSVRKIELGKMPVSGPVSVLMRLLDEGIL